MTKTVTGKAAIESQREHICERRKNGESLAAIRRDLIAKGMIPSVSRPYFCEVVGDLALAVLPSPSRSVAAPAPTYAPLDHGNAHRPVSEQRSNVVRQVFADERHPSDF